MVYIYMVYIYGIYIYIYVYTHCGTMEYIYHGAAVYIYVALFRGARAWLKLPPISGLHMTNS